MRWLLPVFILVKKKVLRDHPKRIRPKSWKWWEIKIFWRVYELWIRLLILSRITSMVPIRIVCRISKSGERAVLWGLRRLSVKILINLYLYWTDSRLPCKPLWIWVWTGWLLWQYWKMPLLPLSMGQKRLMVSLSSKQKPRKKENCGWVTTVISMSRWPTCRIITWWMPERNSNLKN